MKGGAMETALADRSYEQIDSIARTEKE